MSTSPIPPVLDQDRYAVYRPTAATTDFALGFPLFGEASDVAVYLDGTQLALTSDYTVRSVSNGASLTPAPVSDAYVRLNAPISAGTLEIFGDFRPRRTIQASAPYGTRDFNFAFSLLMAALREMWSKFTRAIKVPVGEADLTIPNSMDRAGQVLAFDAAGLPTVGGRYADLIAAASAAAVSAATAQSSAQSAAVSATAAALFDPANYYLRTAFRSDGSPNSPVKYDANGVITTRSLRAVTAGLGIDAEVRIDADTGYTAGTSFYRSGVFKFNVYLAPDNTFGVYNATISSYSLYIDPTTNVTNFAKPTLVNNFPATAWDVELREQQASGVNGASVLSANTWGVRVLNTYVSNSIGSTFNGKTNEVTIPAGQYIAEWDATIASLANGVWHKTRLYNSTAGSVIDYGTAEWSAWTSGNWTVLTRSFGHAMFTVSVATKVRLEHIVSSGASGSATGWGMSDGTPNIYANLRLRKVR